MNLINCRKDKIAAGIVTYNPELKRLKENIEHIAMQVDKIFMFDNGSDNIAEIDELCRKWPEGVVLIKSDMNIGLAAALNRLCRWGVKHGYQYMVTLDQDSVCPEDLVLTLQGNLRPDVAVAAPNIVYRNNECFAVKRAVAEEVEWVITSASLTSLAVWDEIGGFDERLFIDGVDRDFCVRARKKGYHIVKDYNAELMHELGNLKCRKVFGRTIYVTNHAAFRKYYMVRNTIYLDKKHNESRRYSNIMKNIFKTLIFEDGKITKLCAICKGIRDGVKMEIQG